MKNSITKSIKNFFNFFKKIFSKNQLLQFNTTIVNLEAKDTNDQDKIEEVKAIENNSNENNNIREDFLQEEQKLLAQLNEHVKVLVETKNTNHLQDILDSQLSFNYELLHPLFEELMTNMYHKSLFFNAVTQENTFFDKMIPISKEKSLELVSTVEFISNNSTVQDEFFTYFHKNKKNISSKISSTTNFTSFMIHLGTLLISNIKDDKLEIIGDFPFAIKQEVPNVLSQQIINLFLSQYDRYFLSESKIYPFVSPYLDYFYFSLKPEQCGNSLIIKDLHIPDGVDSIFSNYLLTTQIKKFHNIENEHINKTLQDDIKDFFKNFYKTVIYAPKSIEDNHNYLLNKLSLYKNIETISDFEIIANNLSLPDESKKIVKEISQTLIEYKTKQLTADEKNLLIEIEKNTLFMLHNYEQITSLDKSLENTVQDSLKKSLSSLQKFTLNYNNNNVSTLKTDLTYKKMKH
jgi:hypothetical protein